MKYPRLTGILATGLCVTGIYSSAYSNPQDTDPSPLLDSTSQAVETRTLATSPEWDFEITTLGELVGYHGNGGNVVVPSVINGTTVTTVGTAFKGKDHITSVTLPSTVTEIKHFAFTDCDSLEWVVLGTSLQTIGEKAFYHCDVLESVSFPSSLRSIGTLAFGECTTLHTLEFPDGVTSIGAKSFWGCISLEEVTIPTTCRQILEEAFAYCTSLTSLTLPSSLTLMEEGVFRHCTSLFSLVFSTLPSDVMLYPSLFEGCTSLSFVILPNNLEYLPTTMFSACSSLQTLTLPSTLTKISGGAFMDCTSLKVLAIPEGVTYLGSASFQGCVALETLVFPTSVESISATAFRTSAQNATALPLVTFYGYLSTEPRTFAAKYQIPFVDLAVDDYPDLSLPAPVIPDSGFIDVSSQQWYASYVAFVLEYGLMEGSEEYFYPTQGCTRGALANALFTLSGESYASNAPSSFTDVSGTAYEKAIAWCLYQGVMTGYDAALTQFGTEDTLTREQFAVILRSFSFHMKHYRAPSHSSLDRVEAFSDSSSISSWASDAIAWCLDYSFLTGKDGTIDPKGILTRAEVAAILYSYNERYPLLSLEEAELH